MISDYTEAGMPYDSPKVRIDRFAEGLAVIKGVMGAEPYSFTGEHYTITDHNGLPKPVQGPCPPILIGGGGKRVLRLAAREAQIVGFAPRIGVSGGGAFDSCTFEATREKVGWVRDAAGARFDEIELNTYPSFRPASVTDDPKKAAGELLERLNKTAPVALTVDELLDSPHVFIGTVDQLIEKFTRLRDELGISNIMVGNGIDDFAPIVERLAGT